MKSIAPTFLVFLMVASLSSCNATQAKQRSEQRTSSSRPINASQAAITYPTALQGAWMPREMGCSGLKQGESYDGEALVYIGADMLGQYENTSKPLRVEPLAGKSQAWKILTTFSPGTGEYDDQEVIVYALKGNELSIKTGESTSIYVRCDYKLN